MANLHTFKAKKCLTAAAILIHEDKVLLIKHKKVGFWLNPGGHIETDELPHQAAEREFWEETGIKVQALSYGLAGASSDTEALPSPIATNLHWVCRDNYETRVNKAPPTEYAEKHWKKGCEQHLNFLYLVEPVDGVAFTENVEETDGIAWFTAEEVAQLDTNAQIKEEVRFAFKYHRQLQSEG